MKTLEKTVETPEQYAFLEAFKKRTPEEKQLYIYQLVKENIKLKNELYKRKEVQNGHDIENQKFANGS